MPAPVLDHSVTKPWFRLNKPSSGLVSKPQPDRAVAVLLAPSTARSAAWQSHLPRPHRQRTYWKPISGPHLSSCELIRRVAIRQARFGPGSTLEWRDLVAGATDVTFLTHACHQHPPYALRRVGARLISRATGVNCTFNVCPETDTK